MLMGQQELNGIMVGFCVIISLEECIQFFNIKNCGISFGRLFLESSSRGEKNASQFFRVWHENCPTIVKVEVQQNTNKYQFRTCITWIQREITSANRDNDFGGQSPRRAGSTIPAKASISCSCGAAQRTNDCSILGLELKFQTK